VWKKYLKRSMGGKDLTMENQKEKEALPPWPEGNNFIGG